MTKIEIMALDDIILKMHNLNKKKLSKSIGLSYGTVRAIYKGEQKNPTLETMVKLTNYFQQ